MNIAQTHQPTYYYRIHTKPTARSGRPNPPIVLSSLNTPCHENLATYAQHDYGRATHLTTKLGFLLNETFLADVDAVQELPNVLVPDQSALVNERSRATNVLDVHAAEDDLVLNRLGLFDFDTRQNLDHPDALLAEEVTDFNGLPVVSDVGVDGKVRVHEPHLVLVLLGHTGDHVVDVGHDGPDGGDHGPGSEPLHENDGPLVLGKPDFDRHVGKVTREVAVLARDRDLAGLHRNGDCNPLRAIKTWPTSLRDLERV
ncbi:spectrin beta chain, non-erythrocytic 5 [Babesia caballi]|uniref:Spectrin beta chain, non-erythrocytic 5 n=1 Tax=Babesia caballi TaxID=5871 RepID=A0AAV4M0F2_BABCB|nr:spectrin beta chain, non-erythrocytic 5 [Babesia caballi]